MPITNELYKQQYQQMHSNGFFPGQQAAKYVDKITNLLERTGAKSLLDYGCGKGLCYTQKGIHRHWGGIMPTLYDPYYLPHSKRPQGTFGGVICTDVLEHVPEEDVLDVLSDIFSFAREFAFLTISTKKARKTLPNGENAHVTVKADNWWKYMLDLADNKPGLIEVVFTDE